jgi:small subunit ribosomal protein S15|uniref:30S ribosomal protein S15 n=1 Tax=Globisporangium ultimum (strain ATCC 200006 / CBS 805.95 / DAOM BR144) TaxID=431595 RepID=K3WS50_GLOUD
MFALSRLARVSTAAVARVSITSAAAPSVRAISYVAPPKVSKDTYYRFGIKLDDPALATKDGEDENESLTQLKAVLSLQNASQHELNKAQIAKAIETFQRFPGDTGSSEVQIAVLTQKILHSTFHAQQHKKDHHSRRGLIAMVEKRRKLLKYLRREDLQKFRAVVAALGLRFT